MLTPADLDALLERYEAMAQAARANDWERLAALEREAAALRRQVMERNAGTASAPGALPESVRAVVARGIERVLELDAEIRTHTDPFLSSVSRLLSVGQARKAGDTREA